MRAVSISCDSRHCVMKYYLVSEKESIDEELAEEFCAEFYSGSTFPIDKMDVDFILEPPTTKKNAEEFILYKRYEEKIETASTL